MYVDGMLAQQTIHYLCVFVQLLGFVLVRVQCVSLSF